MNNSAYEPPRAFQIDGGWYDAYWLRQARKHAARGIVTFGVAWIARFGRWAANMIWAREVISAFPPEGSPCARGDEVPRARQLLLGEADTRDRTS
jgi:hypothetical protein